MTEVSLAVLSPSHAPAMVAWLADPLVAANLGLRMRPTLERTLTFIAGANDRDSVVARAILLGERHVGTVVLDRIDRHVQTARLHIYVGDPGVRGHKVGQRAVAGAVTLAFDEIGLEKVWLTVHVRNTAAIRAYQAVGFVIEGTHRREFLLDGELIDELYMGMLRSDRPVV